MATVHEPEVLEKEVTPTLSMQVGGSVDIQVATAKRFPRSIESFMRRTTEMATLTPEIAAACVYALPREGKMIEGPSARLAEIVAHAWGNLRIQGGSEGDADGNSPFIVGYGEAWDLESNTAVRFEVRRRITKSTGKRYSDDMIVVTGNAAASIALRNAVFKAVPSPFWRPIYLKCRQVIAGEAQTFAVRRDEMLKKFHVMGVTNDQLYAVLDVKGIADITLDHMVQITGAYNALKEGELSIEEFVESGAAAPAGIKPAQRKSEQQHGGTPATAASESGPTSQTSAPSTTHGGTSPGATTAEPAAATPASTSQPPQNVGVIVNVEEKGGGAAFVHLDTKFICSTRSGELMAAAAAHRDAKRRVELVTRPASDPKKFAPVLEEILVVEAQS